eukprot:2396864-Amphidinium_carterae.2
MSSLPSAQAKILVCIPTCARSYTTCIACSHRSAALALDSALTILDTLLQCAVGTIHTIAVVGTIGASRMALERSATWKPCACSHSSSHFMLATPPHNYDLDPLYELDGFRKLLRSKAGKGQEAPKVLRNNACKLQQGEASSNTNP